MRDVPATTTGAGGQGATTTDRRAVPVTYAAVPEVAADATDCPPERGRAERRLRFAGGPPPMCIDQDAQHVAEVVTNYGTFQLALNPRAPWTVNHFAYLARWRFYEGVGLVVTATEPSGAESGAAAVGESVAVDDPVAPADVAQVPGYGLTFDRGSTTYPDELEPGTVPVVAYDPDHPHRWEIMLTSPAVELVDANRDAYPLLGQLRCGLGVFTDPAGMVRSASLPPSPHVIESVTIHELPAGAELETSPRRDCAGSDRDQQIGLMPGDPCCRLADT